MAEDDNRCSICSDPVEPELTRKFVKIPICPACHDHLGLGEVTEGEPDPILSGIMDEKGREILGHTTGLLGGICSSQGWQLLAMAPLIWEQVEDLTRKVMMSSGLIITGTTLIRVGREGDTGDPDNRFVSLMILLGQYLDLSVMGKINEEKALEKSSFLDELILKEEHDHRLFGLLKDIDHGDNDEKKAIIANAMSLLMP